MSILMHLLAAQIGATIGVLAMVLLIGGRE